MEEAAVREALGLPPSAGAVVDAADGRGRASNRREYYGGGGNNGGGFSGYGSDGGGGGREEGGGGTGSFGQTSRAPGAAPLCLLLSNLGELFRWDVAAAADICADTFPGVRPW